MRADGGLNASLQVDARMILGLAAAVTLGFQELSLARVEAEGARPVVGLGWTASGGISATGDAHGPIQLNLQAFRFGLGYRRHGLPREQSI